MYLQNNLKYSKGVVVAMGVTNIQFDNYGVDDYFLVNSATGEVVQIFKGMSHEEFQHKINAKKKRKLAKELNRFIDGNFGSFYFNYYNKTIDNEYMFRFMYLCTYMNYKNYIEYGSSKDIHKLAVKKNIKEILNLQKTAFHDTYNYWLKNKMIEEDEDGHIKINSQLCNRGKSKRQDYIKRNGCVRMFDKAIRELYENSTTKEHKQIELLMKLLPYVNYQHNIVCSNPEESDIRLVQPLKQKEILEILEKDKKTIQSLSKIKILNGKEGAFIKITNPFVTNAYVINPRFMYKGNDVEELAELTRWFKLGKNKHK